MWQKKHTHTHTKRFARSVCEGFRDALDKREAKLSQKELDAIQFYIKNGIKYEKKLNEQIQIGVEYMKKNKAKAGVIETPTGLQYTWAFSFAFCCVIVQRLCWWSVCCLSQCYRIKVWRRWTETNDEFASDLSCERVSNNERCLLVFLVWNCEILAVVIVETNQQLILAVKINRTETKISGFFLFRSMVKLCVERTIHFDRSIDSQVSHETSTMTCLKTRDRSPTTFGKLHTDILARVGKWQRSIKTAI